MSNLHWQVGILRLLYRVSFDYWYSMINHFIKKVSYSKLLGKFAPLPVPPIWLLWKVKAYSHQIRSLKPSKTFLWGGGRWWCFFTFFVVLFVFEPSKSFKMLIWSIRGVEEHLWLWKSYCFWQNLLRQFKVKSVPTKFQRKWVIWENTFKPSVHSEIYFSKI